MFDANQSLAARVGERLIARGSQIIDSVPAKEKLWRALRLGPAASSSRTSRHKIGSRRSASPPSANSRYPWPRSSRGTMPRSGSRRWSSQYASRVRLSLHFEHPELRRQDVPATAVQANRQRPAKTRASAPDTDGRLAGFSHQFWLFWFHRTPFPDRPHPDRAHFQRLTLSGSVQVSLGRMGDVLPLMA